MDEGEAMCTLHAVVVLCVGYWQSLANESMRIQDLYVGAVPIPQFIQKKSRSWGSRWFLDLVFFCFLSDPDFGFLYFFGVSMCGVVAAYFSIGVRAMVSLPTRTPKFAGVGGCTRKFGV